MATVTVDEPARLFTHRAPRVEASASMMGLAHPSTGSRWSTGLRESLVVVDAVTMTPRQMLRSAVVSKPKRVLNGIGGLSFTMSAWDPKIDSLVDLSTWDGKSSELKLLGNEVQYRRDGVIWTAGPVVAADVDLSGVVTFTAYDYGWYLSRKVMGAGERFDWLEGTGQFDQLGLPGWTRSGVTAVRNTSTKARGVGAAQISGTGALVATFVHDVQTVGQDLTVLLSLMVRIPTGTPEGTRIASITAVPNGDTGPYRVTELNEFTTDSDTQLGEWIRITCRTMMRPDVENTITVALWSHGLGNTYADDCRAMRNDTTGVTPARDLVDHGLAIAGHAQSSRYGNTSFGFTLERGDYSGTSERAGFRHLEHASVLDLFDLYVNRDDGWDWYFDFPSRSLVFTARKGTDHANLVLHNRNVSAGGWGHDDGRRASKVIVLGDGDGVDRPEGSHVDASLTAGVVLDDVYKPPNGTPLLALDPLAVARHKMVSRSQVTPGALVVSQDMLDVLDTGDSVRVQLRAGRLRMAAQRVRVQEITIDRAAGMLELV